MDNKNKRSSSASDDDAESEKHKISDVKTDTASYSKSLKSGKGVLKPCNSESLKSVFLLGKRVLEACSEINVNLKEQEMKSEETKEMTKSIKELTKAIEKLQETLQPKHDLFEMVSLKGKDRREKEVKTKTCGFDCEEADGNDWHTIFVKGFQRSRPRNEIKKMLSDIFGQCGELIRVFVPIECGTRVPLGFAFINFISPKNNAKALELNGRSLEGRKLTVTMASTRSEYFGFTNFVGCHLCGTFTPYRQSSPWLPIRVSELAEKKKVEGDQVVSESAEKKVEGEQVFSESAKKKMEVQGEGEHEPVEAQMEEELKSINKKRENESSETEVPAKKTKGEAAAALALYLRGSLSSFEYI